MPWQSGLTLTLCPGGGTKSSMVEDGSARVRWLVVGELGGQGPPERARVDSATFAEVMGRRSIEVSVDLGPAFGLQSRATVKLSKLRDLSLQAVVAVTPALAPLAEAVAGLALVDPAARPSREALSQKLEAAYGSGAWSRLVDKSWPVQQGSTTGRATLDQILESPSEGSNLASSGVDAFIRGIRTSPSGPGAGSKGAHRALEQALYDAAAIALRAPELQRIEGHWRGLKLLLDECTTDSAMAVELLEASKGQRVARIESTLAAEPTERPDAIFVVDPVADVAELDALADLAEGLSLPIVAEVSANLFGADDPASLARSIDDGASVPKSYDQLRLESRSRWLSTSCNRVRVLAEGSGTARRTVLGSATYAVAAMLAASFRATGAFARFLKPEGALKAPAVETLSAGVGAGTACPTETYLPSSAQSTLARAGILGLGSTKNSDQLRVSKAPMISAAGDAVDLPSQILTGRVVRFSQWIRDQVPSGASNDDARELFEQAVGAFLFPGQSEMAAVSAQVIEAEGRRQLAVTANLRPELAGTFLKLAFALPLG